MLNTTGLPACIFALAVSRKQTFGLTDLILRDINIGSRVAEDRGP